MPPDFEPGGELPKSDLAFHTTHWSVVLAARDRQGPAARDALAKLCSAYWYPLYSFVRHRGFNPHDAEDLTQEFFCRFLEKNPLLNVAPEGGKFRSFLLTCLKNFLANQWQRDHAQRRGGGQCPISLDGGEAETRLSLEPADSLTAEAIYEKRWALTVLERTMQATQRDYAEKRQSDVFESLKGFLPGGRETESRAALAGQQGVSVGAIDVAVHRLRKRFGALLRQEIAHTVSSEAEVDEEIKYLIAVIGSYT